MGSQLANAPAATRNGVTAPAGEYRLIAAVLFIAAIVPFLRSLGFGFVYDDTFIVQHNPVIVGWRSLLTLWQHPYWTDAEGAQAGLYRPVHTAVLAIIRNAGAGWPLWFHLYALVLHGTVTLLVWRMLARGVGRWPAALAALWFAVHPVHVEAVANISNTAEPLVALWALALYFVIARDRDTGASWRRSVLAGVLFTLAMLSKESGVMSLAVALVAVEAWRPRGTRAARGAEATSAPSSWFSPWYRWRRVAIAGLVSIVVVFAMRSMVLAGATSGASLAAVGIENMSILERVWAMISLGPVILGLLVWPRVLNPYYGPSTFPTGPHAIIAVMLTLLTLALVVGMAVRLARRDAADSSHDMRPLAAIGWILLAFLPASNLLVATGQILAERTLYLSSIGMAMLLAWALDRIMIAIAHTRTTRPEWRRIAIGIVPIIILMVSLRFAALARESTRAWRSHRALIDQMIDADSNGYRGHYLLAVELRRGGATDSIAHELQTAYRLYPRDPQLDLEYARFLLGHQQALLAVQVTNMLMSDLRMHDDADAIGVYLEARGRAYGADSVLAEASRLYRIRPHPTLALYMGLAYEARTNRTAALSAYRAGLQLAPRDSALTARLAALQ